MDTLSFLLPSQTKKEFLWHFQRDFLVGSFGWHNPSAFKFEIRKSRIQGRTKQIFWVPRVCQIRCADISSRGT